MRGFESSLMKKTSSLNAASSFKIILPFNQKDAALEYRRFDYDELK
jgi:hypothetical protein